MANVMKAYIIVMKENEMVWDMIKCYTFRTEESTWRDTVNYSLDTTTQNDLRSSYSLFSFIKKCRVRNVQLEKG